MLDYDFREVQVSRQIMASARETWLVSDHTKFGRNATVRLCSLADVNALFTDRAPPENLAALMSGAGGQIYVAETELDARPSKISEIGPPAGANRG